MSIDRRKVGLLFDRRTRVQLVIAVAGSLLVAVLEILALAALVPLMNLLTTGSVGVGFLEDQFARWGINANDDASAVLAAVIFGAFFIKGAISLVFRWWVSGFIAKQQVATSTRLLKYFLEADYALHLKRSLSEFIRILNDAVVQTYATYVMGIVMVVTEVFTIVAVAVSLIVLAPIPALMMVAYFSIAVGLLYLAVRRRALESGQRSLEASKAMFGTAVQAILSIKDIKIRNNAAAFVDPYRAARIQSAQAGRVVAFLSDVPRYLLEILFVLGIALMTVFVFSYAPGPESIAILTLFAVGGFRILPSVTRMLASLNNLKISTPAFELVLEENADAHDYTLQHVDSSLPLPLTSELVLEGVSYSYPDADSATVTDLDLRLPAGTSLALVGSSGAGKTTIVDLLLGLHAPTRGRILADGVDVHENLPGWQENLAMVPQSVIVIAGTVTENLVFGSDVDSSPEHLISTLKQAQLGDWLEALPDGLNTMIGDGGVGLSGGERQRLGLARALLTNPSLLVLDEATSALDNVTERRITMAIASLSGQVTTVVVAHRLSTVRHCDQVAFVRQGRLVAVDSFDGLRQRVAEFDQMVRLGSLDLPVKDRLS